MPKSLWAWNDTFPPLNLWNYPKHMDREYIDAPKSFAKCATLAEYQAQVKVAEKQQIPNIGNELTTPAGANAKQFGGDHYKNKAIQPWDYISSNNMGFLEGCIIKYVSRYQDKNGVEDLKKAMHFLEKLIEVRSV